MRAHACCACCRARAPAHADYGQHMYRTVCHASTPTVLPSGQLRHRQMRHAPPSSMHVRHSLCAHDTHALQQPPAAILQLLAPPLQARAEHSIAHARRCLPALNTSSTRRPPTQHSTRRRDATRRGAAPRKPTATPNRNRLEGMRGVAPAPDALCHGAPHRPRSARALTPPAPPASPSWRSPR